MKAKNILIKKYKVNIQSKNEIKKKFNKTKVSALVCHAALGRLRGSLGCTSKLSHQVMG